MMAGVAARRKRDVPARLRLWHSSPMCKAWLISARRSMPPSIDSIAAWSVG